ncbi:MAG: phenylacetic acid degradation protein, partial [Ginsengibacter sp.]
MALHFHPLTIKSMQPQTANGVCITFNVPAELKDTFAFKHGQTLTLRTHINGENIRRNYSICSSPFDNELRV